MERLKTYGKNELEKGKTAGIFKLFFSQFKDFMTPPPTANRRAGLFTNILILRVMFVLVLMFGKVRFIVSDTVLIVI